MKRTTLCPQPHTTSNEMLIEVWHEGKFIAAIYAADGPGIRIVSKYPMQTVQRPEVADPPGVIEVRMKI